MKQLGLAFLSFTLIASAHAEPQAVPINFSETGGSKLPAANGQISQTMPIMDSEDLNFDMSVDAFGDEINLTQDNKYAGTEPEKIKVDTSQSLTDNIKDNAPVGMIAISKPETSTNWVGQLISTAKETTADTKKPNPLANMLEQSKQKNLRSNASLFDVSGVMLRMSYKQAEDALAKRGYKKTTQKMDIPNFIRWRNEEKCRNQGVIGYERLENCVIKLAREEKYQFVSQAQFNKYDSKETVQIFLTSTFTNNKIYKITYRTEAANVTGNSSKALYLRNIKVYDFWKKINQKYGVPDNKEDVVWSLGGNKPYMKAATGYLLLEDPMLRELDFTRMSREDQRFMNTDLYTF